MRCSWRSTEGAAWWWPDLALAARSRCVAAGSGIGGHFTPPPSTSAAWWQPDLVLAAGSRHVEGGSMLSGRILTLGISPASTIWWSELELEPTPGMWRPDLLLVCSSSLPPLLPLPLGARCSMAQATSSLGPGGGAAPCWLIRSLAGSFRHPLSPAAVLRFFGEVKIRPLDAVAGQAPWWGLCRLPWTNSVFPLGRSVCVGSRHLWSPW
jgi:hypothetical protein